jgi:hypothetical protein
MLTLAKKCPEIAKLWHPTKNNNLLPTEIHYNSSKKVWWLCPIICEYGCLHEYEQLISEKTLRDRGCPYCCIPPQKICYHSSVEFKYPTLINEFHPDKNGSTKLSQLSINSSKKVWWICPNTCEYGCIHEYEQQIICKTIMNQECPYCCVPAQKVCYHFSLEFKYPEIAKLWHPTKNETLKPDQISCGSERKVWWQCFKNCEYGCIHEYQMAIKQKIRQNQGCPYCVPGRPKFCYHFSLEFKYPEIAKLWHPIKNETLTPDKVSRGTNKIVWWQCPKKCEYGCLHEYQMTICGKTSDKQGCPYCCIPAQKICYHSSFEFLYPAKSKLWHPTKNKDLQPSMVSFGSGIKVWWVCGNDPTHEYEQAIYSAISQGCPYCVNKTEKKLYDWLNDNYPDLNIKRQARFDWCPSPHSKMKYPFDICILDYNLIIELDGNQHFKQVLNWSAPEEIQKTDVYKMDKALSNEHSVIRILQTDVYYDRNNWEDHLKKRIKMYKTPTIFYICDKDQYKCHKAMMKSLEYKDTDINS